MATLVVIKWTTVEEWGLFVEETKDAPVLSY